MTNTRQISIWAACIAGSFAAAFAAVGASRAGSEPVRCEIVTGSSGGGVFIEALAHADDPMVGTYTLEVTGPGTSISQAGDFEVASARPTVLGSVMLGGGNGSRHVRLEVEGGGHTATCNKAVG